MKLGLLTDIHEQVDHLRSALDQFRQERVEQVVFLGDLFLTYSACLRVNGCQNGRGLLAREWRTDGPRKLRGGQQKGPAVNF